MIKTRGKYEHNNEWKEPELVEMPTWNNTQRRMRLTATHPAKVMCWKTKQQQRSKMKYTETANLKNGTFVIFGALLDSPAHIQLQLRWREGEKSGKVSDWTCFPNLLESKCLQVQESQWIKEILLTYQDICCFWCFHHFLYIQISTCHFLFTDKKIF